MIAAETDLSLPSAEYAWTIDAMKAAVLRYDDIAIGISTFGSGAIGRSIILNERRPYLI